MAVDAPGYSRRVDAKQTGMTMRYVLGVILAMVMAGSALAQSVTFGSKLIVIGDSVAKVFEVAGKPDRVVQLENRYGAAMGERFEYYRGGKTITITISGSRVVDVSETD